MKASPELRTSPAFDGCELRSLHYRPKPAPGREIDRLGRASRTKEGVHARAREQVSATPNNAILGPEGFEWRGATLHVALSAEEPLIARLEEVQGIGMRAVTAKLTVLDARGQPTGVPAVAWPPEGEVRVVRGAMRAFSNLTLPTTGATRHPLS